MEKKVEKSFSSQAYNSLPINKINETLRAMYSYGFWGKILARADYTDSAVFWVAPHEIRRVIFWTEEAQSEPMRRSAIDMSEESHDF